MASETVSFRPITLQRKNWLDEFMKTFLDILNNSGVVCAKIIDKPANSTLNKLNSGQARKEVQPKVNDAIDEISQFEKKIEELECEIDTQYKGPCFDQTYRILTEKCCQYQQELDIINVIGKPEIRLKRKNCLVRIDNAATKLNNKTHEDGKPCPRCTVRN